jgi:small subunit ribosomal protein S36
VRNPAPDDFVPQPFAEYLQFFVQHFSRRFWGSFGWLEVSLPWWVVIAAAAVVLVGLIGGLVCRRRSDVFRRVDILLLVLPTLAIIAIVLPGAWSSYQFTGLHNGVQGRYVLPGVVALASAVAIGYGSMLRFLRPLLPPTVLLFAGFMHLIAAVEMLRGFWMRPAALDATSAVRAWLAWAPWPAAVLLVTGGLVLSLSLVLLLTLVAAAGNPLRARPALAGPGRSDHHPDSGHSVA